MKGRTAEGEERGTEDRKAVRGGGREGGRDAESGGGGLRDGGDRSGETPIRKRVLQGDLIGCRTGKGDTHLSQVAQLLALS